MCERGAHATGGGGREAMAEARAGRREEKRAREESPEINKLPGGGSVMGGDDSFAAARARCGLSGLCQSRSLGLVVAYPDSHKAA